MKKLNVGFAWAQDGMLKLAKAELGGVHIIADICPCTHENIDEMIKSLQELKENLRTVKDKLH